MKRTRFSNDGTRFSGRLRHYHRAGTGIYRSWDEWVDGEKSNSANWLNLLKIVGFLVLLLILAVIAAGMVMVLR